MPPVCYPCVDRDRQHQLHVLPTTGLSIRGLHSLKVRVLAHRSRRSILLAIGKTPFPSEAPFLISRSAAVMASLGKAPSWARRDGAPMMEGEMLEAQASYMSHRKSDDGWAYKGVGGSRLGLWVWTEPVDTRVGPFRRFSRYRLWWTGDAGPMLFMA